MRDGGWNTLAEAERVATDKIRTIGERVVKGVEEIGSCRVEEVPDVLSKCIYVLPTWILSNLL